MDSLPIWSNHTDFAEETEDKVDREEYSWNSPIIQHFLRLLLTEQLAAVNLGQKVVFFSNTEGSNM